jgi:hypothetical protein
MYGPQNVYLTQILTLRKREKNVFEALRRDKRKIETDLGILTYPDIASI